MTEDKARKWGRAFQVEGTAGAKPWGVRESWDALGTVTGPWWRTVRMVDRWGRDYMTLSVRLSYVKPLKAGVPRGVQFGGLGGGKGFHSRHWFTNSPTSVLSRGPLGERCL